MVGPSKSKDDKVFREAHSIACTNIMYPDSNECTEVSRKSCQSTAVPSSPGFDGRCEAASRQVPEMNYRDSNRQLALKNVQLLKNLKNLNRLSIKLWIQHVADRLKLHSAKRSRKPHLAVEVIEECQVLFLCQVFTLFNFLLRRVFKY